MFSSRKRGLCCNARHRLAGLIREVPKPESLDHGKACEYSSAAGRGQAALPPALLELDLHVDAGGQVELHQRVHRLVGRIDDVHQALVRADLELVAARLVDVRRAQDVETLHARRQGHGALDDRAGALGGVDDLERRLVDELVVERLEADADLLLGCHDGPPYSRILATTPAPTVRPPSRMAKRRPSSMAIGLISLTVIETLSPGITISLSLASSTAPVTSVVRK